MIYCSSWYGICSVAVIGNFIIVNFYIEYKRIIISVKKSLNFAPNQSATVNLNPSCKHANFANSF